MSYLIGELFRSTLSNDSEMEPQLNAMRQKVHVLKSLGQSLDDSLVIVTIIISLPTSYSTLCTILMTTAGKLTVNWVVSQIIIEEKSCKTMQSACVSPIKPLMYSSEKSNAAS